MARTIVLECLAPAHGQNYTTTRGVKIIHLCSERTASINNLATLIDTEAGFGTIALDEWLRLARGEGLSSGMAAMVEELSGELWHVHRIAIGNLIC